MSTSQIRNDSSVRSPRWATTSWRYQSACHGYASRSSRQLTRMTLPWIVPAGSVPDAPAVSIGPMIIARCGWIGVPSAFRNWSQTGNPTGGTWCRWYVWAARKFELSSVTSSPTASASRTVASCPGSSRTTSPTTSSTRSVTPAAPPDRTYRSAPSNHPEGDSGSRTPTTSAGRAVALYDSSTPPVISAPGSSLRTSAILVVSVTRSAWIDDVGSVPR